MFCFFVSDLHGVRSRYAALFEQIKLQRPDAVFIGGDFLPSRFLGDDESQSAFLLSYFLKQLDDIRSAVKDDYPRIFIIMGNDDERSLEAALVDAESDGLLEYIHGKSARLGEFSVYGYACVPPTPFMLKDWERYDISRYVDPGCISPEDGKFSVPMDPHQLKYTTIKKDIENLVASGNMEKSIFLFHAPPYDTSLDTADLEGVKIDGVPLDRHIGSIAIRNFIDEHKPLLTLHGHVHESARLSGSWTEVIGLTRSFSAAHDGPELALVQFSPDDPANARRILL